MSFSNRYKMTKLESTTYKEKVSCKNSKCTAVYFEELQVYYLYCVQQRNYNRKNCWYKCLMVYQIGNTKLVCGIIEEFQDYFKAEYKQKTYTSG